MLYYYHDGNGWRLLQFVCWHGLSAYCVDVYRGGVEIVPAIDLMEIQPRTEWED